MRLHLGVCTNDGVGLNVVQIEIGGSHKGAIRRIKRTEQYLCTYSYGKCQRPFALQQSIWVHTSSPLVGRHLTESGRRADEMALGRRVAHRALQASIPESSTDQRHLTWLAGTKLAVWPYSDPRPLTLIARSRTLRWSPQLEIFLANGAEPPYSPTYRRPEAPRGRCR